MLQPRCATLHLLLGVEPARERAHGLVQLRRRRLVRDPRTLLIAQPAPGTDDALRCNVLQRALTPGNAARVATQRGAVQRSGTQHGSKAFQHARHRRAIGRCRCASAGRGSTAYDGSGGAYRCATARSASETLAKRTSASLRARSLSTRSCSCAGACVCARVRACGCLRAGVLVPLPPDAARATPSRPRLLDVGVCWCLRSVSARCVCRVRVCTSMDDLRGRLLKRCEFMPQLRYLRLRTRAGPYGRCERITAGRYGRCERMRCGRYGRCERMRSGRYGRCQWIRAGRYGTSSAAPCSRRLS
jgi:hypothetical protein